MIFGAQIFISLKNNIYKASLGVSSYHRYSLRALVSNDISNFRPNETTNIKKLFNIFNTFGINEDFGEVYYNLFYKISYSDFLNKICNFITISENRQFIENPDECVERIKILENKKNLLYKFHSNIIFILRSVLNKFVYPALNKPTKKNKEDEEQEEQEEQVPLKNMIVFSRVSRDIVRMSDFDTLTSCHGVGGMYASCATQEASSDGGGILYYFTNVEDLSDDVEFIKELESSPDEFMYDSDRGETRSLKYIPDNRLRLRTLKIQVYNHNDELLDTIILHVVASRIYGDPPISSFAEYCYEYFRNAQKDKIDKLFEYKKRSENGERLDYRYFIYGGGYVEPDDYSKDLNAFLGFILDKSFYNYKLSREYPKESPRQREIQRSNPHMPSEEDIRQNYEDYILEDISDKKLFRDLFAINMDVTVEDTTIYDDSDQLTGYYSGHPRPQDIEDYDESEYDYNISNKLTVTMNYTDYANTKVEWIQNNIGKLTLDTAEKIKDEFYNIVNELAIFHDYYDYSYNLLNNMSADAFFDYNEGTLTIEFNRDFNMEEPQGSVAIKLENLAKLLNIIMKNAIPLDKDGREKYIYDAVLEDLKQQGKEAKIQELKNYMKKFLK